MTTTSTTSTTTTAPARTSVIETVANRLYWTAAVLYAVSLASRTVLEWLAYLPAVEDTSRTLAGVLRFLVAEIQMLAMPPVATLCLVAAFLLRPTVTSLLARSHGRVTDDEAL